MNIHYGNQDLQGDTPLALILEMRKSSIFDQDRSVEGFMEAISQRVKTATGKAVRTSSPEAFLADLISAGIVKEN